MTPPMDKGTQATSQVTSAPQAVSALAQPKLTKITKRAEFLRAANAKRQAAPGFLVQARARNDGDLELRVGFTCSKKIGNAVARNRAKRRLRAVARAITRWIHRVRHGYFVFTHQLATLRGPLTH